MCPYCRGEGWICEEHPTDVYGHGGCHGAGVPCQNPECPSGRENLARKRAERLVEHQFDRDWYPDGPLAFR